MDTLVNVGLVLLIFGIAACGYKVVEHNGLRRLQPRHQPTPEQAWRQLLVTAVIAVAVYAYMLWQHSEQWFAMLVLAVILCMAVTNWWLVSRRKNHA